MPEDPIIYFDLGLIKQGYVWNFPKAAVVLILEEEFCLPGSRGKQNLRHLVAPDYATEFEGGYVSGLSTLAKLHLPLGWPPSPPLPIGRYWRVKRPVS